MESVNPVLEEKPIPVPSFSDQIPNCTAILNSRFPVSELAGDIIDISPN